MSTPKKPNRPAARHTLPSPEALARQQKVLADWGLAPAAPEPVPHSVIDTVFDTLCLAGAPRGKTWLVNFLRGIGWRAPGQARAITAEEITQALHDLEAQGRAHNRDGQGWAAEPAAWLARWPALRQHADAPSFWRIWVWATNGAHGNPGQTGWATLRSEADAVALARLALMAHPPPEEFNQMARQTLARAATPPALLAALTDPWDPDFLAELPPALLWGLISSLDSTGDRKFKRPFSLPKAPRQGA